MAESNTCWPAYARVPPFLPVPVRARECEWTADKQARFIGLLAESGSVAQAARGVGMSRMAAYRLRRTPGSASFVHAWDTVMALRKRAAGQSVNLPRLKVTADSLSERGIAGEFRVVLRRGRFIRAWRKLNNSALLRQVRRMDALATRWGWEW